MTQHLFAVYDAKAQAFTTPFPANTLGIAERLFSDLVNQHGHQFNKHPADYTLFKIGTFDTASGELKSISNEQLATGLQLLDSSRDSLPIPGI